MKVLITGAAGFVGSHLAKSLLKDGYAVRGFVRPTKDTSVL
jgi:nucleoside-diphosphate-sugar epimerase